LQVGIPALGAVMSLRPDLLSGIHLALAVNVILTMTVVGLVHAGLNWQR